MLVCGIWWKTVKLFDTGRSKFSKSRSVNSQRYQCSCLKILQVWFVYIMCAPLPPSLSSWTLCKTTSLRQQRKNSHRSMSERDPGSTCFARDPVLTFQSRNWNRIFGSRPHTTWVVVVSPSPDSSTHQEQQWTVWFPNALVACVLYKTAAKNNCNYLQLAPKVRKPPTAIKTQKTPPQFFHVFPSSAVSIPSGPWSPILLLAFENMAEADLPQLLCCLRWQRDPAAHDLPHPRPSVKDLAAKCPTAQIAKKTAGTPKKSTVNFSKCTRSNQKLRKLNCWHQQIRSIDWEKWWVCQSSSFVDFQFHLRRGFLQITPPLLLNGNTHISH